MAEELPQQGPALLFHHPAGYLHLVAEARVAAELVERAAAAGLLVPGAEDQPLQSAVDDGASAHGARLLGDIQRAPLQAPVAERVGSGGDGQELGVGGGVGQGFPPVVPPPDDLALAHHHGPYRHLSGLEGALSFFQRLAEEAVVRGFHSGNIDSLLSGPFMNLRWHWKWSHFATTLDKLLLIIIIPDHQIYTHPNFDLAAEFVNRMPECLT